MGRTQQQLADSLADELGLTKRTARTFVQRLVELVADDLVNTERIELRGLGIFAVHTIPERQIVHPGTGQPITIPARSAVRYRSSASLRRRLNPPEPKRKSRRSRKR